MRQIKNKGISSNKEFLSKKTYLKSLKPRFNSYKKYKK